jgi:hypothetical protein
MDKFDKVGKHYRPLVYILSHFPKFVNRKMQKFVKNRFLTKWGFWGGKWGGNGVYNGGEGTVSKDDFSYIEQP